MATESGGKKLLRLKGRVHRKYIQCMAHLISTLNITVLFSKILQKKKIQVIYLLKI